MTFADITQYAKNALSGDISTQQDDLGSYMLYYGMTTNKEINNKYLIAYLVNFLNFIAKYGQITYNLSSSLDFVGLKTLMHNKLSSWIEDAISGADEKGNVTIILDEGTPQAEKVKTTVKTLLNYKEHMLTGWFSDEKIRDNIFLPNDYEVKLNIITHLDANFSEYNGIKNLNDIQYSSALSDGYITENMEQKLLDNLVYSKISDNKVRFQGTISDISAICSSSSSSSSCDFIAYMKLA